MQLLCLKVTARYLGFDCGQTRSSSCSAGCNRNVTSVIALQGLGSVGITRLCPFDVLHVNGCNRDGVVKLVGGTVQAVAVFKSNCVYLGSDCGLILGRQAAWRLGAVAVFKSD